MKARYLPVVGVLVSIVLFVVAAARYPGGTLDSKAVVGYDWTRHYVSTLFAPTALNGEANRSRWFAIPAMLMLCTSISTLFRRISANSASVGLRKTIEIAGIGSMVYTFLAVTTRMHDLLVTVGLAFFVTAVVAVLQFLRVTRQTNLFRLGVLCVVIVGASSVMYYGHVFYGLLAVSQKLGFVMCAGWLVAVYLDQHKAEMNELDAKLR